MGAEDKLFSLEYNIFTAIRDEIFNQINRIQQTAKAVAQIDVLHLLHLWLTEIIMLSLK